MGINWVFGMLKIGMVSGVIAFVGSLMLGVIYSAFYTYFNFSKKAYKLASKVFSILGYCSAAMFFLSVKVYVLIHVIRFVIRMFVSELRA